MDLEKFFDRVDHRLLMTRLARTIKDRRVLRLIRRYLKAEIVRDGQREKRQEGMPQVGPLSPLLSNILLDELDKELERRGHSFCRYADDCNILREYIPLSANEKSFPRRHYRSSSPLANTATQIMPLQQHLIIC